MTELTLTERTEPFTLEEVFDFIDDTNISKTDAHELKNRIVDVVRDARNKAIDEFLSNIEWETINHWVFDLEDEEEYENFLDEISKLAEQLKKGV